LTIQILLQLRKLVLLYSSDAPYQSLLDGCT